MTAALVGGREATGRAFGFLRHYSIAFTRTLSSLPFTVGGAAEEEKKPKRRRKKNLFEVAQFLPDWGVGYIMAKNHWHGTGYKITKINLYKDGRHGKAWGIFHKDGLPSAEGEKKISGVHKRGWRYIPEPKKKQLSMSEPVEQNLAS